MSLNERGVRAVVLDIEGTTTPMSFVHEVLFSYARTHLAGFLRDPAHADLLQQLGGQFASEHQAEPEAVKAPPWQQDTPDELLNSVTVYAGWLMDRDRKSPALKALQGHIWDVGYRAGQLRGAVFSDVPIALQRWHADGLIIAIYSSGSILAQRLIFSMTDEGDLTPFISHFFDTGVGPKRSADSYARIAAALKQEPAHILFISDVAEELDAARSAGWQVALAVRPDHFA
ncbi:MAG TPA: acireductone synthase, partial [Vicinamibacterales bacterium]|nr:acireductone synthase [Vicinamibacterales bacterium]